MKLYIDDLRPTPEGYHYRVFTAKDAILMLERGGITHVSFDHDLGEDEAGTGYEVARWVEEQAYNGTLDRFTWEIHSANPVGRQNMKAALEAANAFWEARARDPDMKQGLN